ncbi:VOC family protein [Microbacterium sp. ET2]|uniref:VOC family protein n=1 Tax=Microbacterium albipurpureum TaxID=3050384 RepID=UPI00259C805B|nr:VOC family protein [Microbacterium sp. ET2 (Ac-2212)]WJL96623.1 VOC family protein [Microbacterium sp. ET2 (Ac-2212)]
MNRIPLKPLAGQVHHLGYVVDDLEAAVARFAAATGAGPFFFSEHVRLDEVTTGTGEPAVYDHSSAIGQLGDIAVEFMVVHDVLPSSVKEPLTGFASPALHHVAWAVEDWDAVVAQLDAAGAPSYMQARFGAMRTSYHDASALVGHHIEIHLQNPDLVAFFGMVRDASVGWDGTQVLRRLEL